MLLQPKAQGRSGRPHGSGRNGLAELRRRLADLQEPGDGTRQRLLELAQRLERVQAFGGEYVRVGFSEMAEAVLTPAEPVACGR